MKILRNQRKALLSLVIMMLISILPMARGEEKTLDEDKLLKQLKDATVYLWFETLTHPSDINIIKEISPQVTVRLWAGSGSKAPYRWAVEAVHGLGILFCGGASASHIESHGLQGWTEWNMWQRKILEYENPLPDRITNLQKEEYWTLNIKGENEAQAGTGHIRHIASENEDALDYIIDHYLIPQLETGVDIIHVDQPGFQMERRGFGFSDYGIGTKNVVEFNTAVPSASASSGNGFYVIDGNDNSLGKTWMPSDEAPHFIIIDFGRRRTVSQIKLFFQGNGFQYNIAYLRDKNSWETLPYEKRFITDSITWINFLPVYTRQIKLEIPQGSAAIREVQIFNYGFRQYLINKYVVFKNWDIKDKRWQHIFGVDLNDKQQSSDGTIESFNYRAYLAERCSGSALISGPNNLLKKEWGTKEEIKAYRYGFHFLDKNETRYWIDRRERAWRYIAMRLKEWAQLHKRQILLSANNVVLNNIDFQLIDAWQHYPKNKRNEIDFSKSALYSFRNAVRIIREYLDTPDIPVVFYTSDWGKNYKFALLGAKERELLIRLYSAEVYAAGGYYCFVARINAEHINYDAQREGDLKVMARLSSFYNKYSEFYHSVEWIKDPPVEVEMSGISKSMFKQAYKNRFIIHIINHNISNMDTLLKKDVVVEVKLNVTNVKKVWTVSPDQDGSRFIIAQNLGGQKYRFSLPELKDYSMVVIEY